MITYILVMVIMTNKGSTTVQVPGYPTLRACLAASPTGKLNGTETPIWVDRYCVPSPSMPANIASKPKRNV